MLRRRRHLFISFVALLLFAETTIWIHSYHEPESLVVHPEDWLNAVIFFSDRGLIRADFLHVDAAYEINFLNRLKAKRDTEQFYREHNAEFSTIDPGNTWHGLGCDSFRYDGGPAGAARFGFGIVLPAWLLIAATVGLPLGSRYLLRYRAKRRRSLGRCVKCGYDLRNTRPLPRMWSVP